MKKKIILSIANTIVLFLALYTLAVTHYIKQQDNTQTAAFLPTPIISHDDDISFYDLVGQEVNLNNGITMELIPLLQTANSQLLPAKHFDFVVFNNTTEIVKFNNQGFGLEIYTIESNAWKLLNLQYVPLALEKKLPPKLQKIDFNIANIWSVSEKNLSSLQARNIRLYVHGVGEKTNNLFGAYLDISLP